MGKPKTAPKGSVKEFIKSSITKGSKKFTK
jgi:hypothetical protein